MIKNKDAKKTEAKIDNQDALTQTADNAVEEAVNLVKLPLIKIDKIRSLPSMKYSLRRSDSENTRSIKWAKDNKSDVIIGIDDDEGGVRPMGTYAVVLSEKSPIKATALGISDRVEIIKVVTERAVTFAIAKPSPWGTDNLSTDMLKACGGLLKDKLSKFGVPPAMVPLDQIDFEAAKSLNELVLMCYTMCRPTHDFYKLLEESDPIERFHILLAFIEEDLQYNKIINGIEEEVTRKIAKQNKEYILREHRIAIDKQLGDDDKSEYLELEKKIKELNCADDVKQRLSKELARLQRMSETAPEAAIIRNYLDWAIELPWNNICEDTKDIKRVAEVLDEDHYGIEKVKQRIIEFIAVRMLAGGNAAGMSLCLVGPPGVGKTTVARSIAKALDKDFVQLTLGGVHDEAEIRGHRRTYIGAMPGRIMSSMSKCKFNNPVFLLDEADKITKDMRGDPQSALLEVLDPNQNKIFRDNYLEIPYNLSDVMFIVTANDISTIDKPLLDRMEVIHMDGYTTFEKLNIAKKYLVAKQSKLNGLNDGVVEFSDAAIIEIIDGYTREAGVRELERKIAAICRKIAYDKVLNGDVDSVVSIDTASIVPMLKKRIYHAQNSETKGKIGRAIGLAWNGYGGTALDIEVAIMAGKGELRLTGNLGDVMKESAQIALSIVRERADKLGILPSFFKDNDVHIHVPEGAVPKDGPSAGVTMAAALMSAIIAKPLTDTLAMTGEVSLTGRVMPIGGLKEKSLAANRLGIRKVLIPCDNEADLDDVPSEVKDNIEFLTMHTIEDVFREAIQGYAD